jgi:putative transposase
VLTTCTEVTDPMLIFSEHHLRSSLAGYQSPLRPMATPPRPPAHLSAAIKRRPVLGGLINEYERVA